MWSWSKQPRASSKPVVLRRSTTVNDGRLGASAGLGLGLVVGVEDAVLGEVNGEREALACSSQSLVYLWRYADTSYQCRRRDRSRSPQNPGKVRTDGFSVIEGEDFGDILIGPHNYYSTRFTVNATPCEDVTVSADS